MPETIVRTGFSRKRRLGLSMAERQRATHANRCLELGLRGGPDGERDALSLAHVDRRIHARMPGGARGLVDPGGGWWRQRYGVPEHLCSDNGPEFIAYAIQDWLKEKQVKTIYITSGSPWEDAYIESFHDKLRAEC